MTRLKKNETLFPKIYTQKVVMIKKMEEQSV